MVIRVKKFKRPRHQRGQAILEFALVFPLFVFLIFFIDYLYSGLDMGQWISIKARMKAMVRLTEHDHHFSSVDTGDVLAPHPIRLKALDPNTSSETRLKTRLNIPFAAVARMTGSLSASGLDQQWQGAIGETNQKLQRLNHFLDVESRRQGEEYSRP